MLNKQNVFYNKIILALSTTDCLASNSNSKIKNWILGWKGNWQTFWMPRQATSSSLATPCAALLNLNPKGRCPSQVDKGHSLAEVYLWLCFQAGTKQALKCITSHFYIVLPYLLTYLFIQRRLCARHWK